MPTTEMQELITVPGLPDLDPSTLGRVAVIDRRVVWIPAPDLSKPTAAMITAAVEYFNDLASREGWEVEVEEREERAKVQKKWWGFVVELNHGEACSWTAVAGGSSAGDIAARLTAVCAAGWFLPLALPVGVAILAASAYIRSMNENSGGKGVRLKFYWPCVYYCCERLGRGPSPC